MYSIFQYIEPKSELLPSKNSVPNNEQNFKRNFSKTLLEFSNPSLLLESIVGKENDAEALQRIPIDLAEEQITMGQFIYRSHNLNLLSG